MSARPNLRVVGREQECGWSNKDSRTPLHNALLRNIQRRNTILDAIFYDVGCVTKHEIPSLVFWLAQEGAILIVPPTGQGTLSVSNGKQEFFDKGGREVAALAVAGVGSSALGAAAFARNIADALGAPVAAVISGYGMSDVLTEALGGFFWFGALNSIRHTLEGLDRLTNAAESEAALTATENLAWTRLSKDTATLIDLLSDRDFKPPYLIGHSKGNLVISEALYALENMGDVKELAKRSRIITISAKIGMPTAFRQVLDIMGQWDGFGALNSRPDIPADYIVPGAWHSTNPDFPCGMGIRVTNVLREALPLFDLPRPRRHRPVLSPYMDLPQKAACANLRST
ncbi:MAG: hypothetical protein KDI65_02500 [Alphaproteobacteria bacterium]|nr:hypothetical protein [Alphaproteobacteria bacterium]